MYGESREGKTYLTTELATQVEWSGSWCAGHSWKHHGRPWRWAHHLGHRLGLLRDQGPRRPLVYLAGTKAADPPADPPPDPEDAALFYTFTAWHLIGCLLIDQMCQGAPAEDGQRIERVIGYGRIPPTPANGEEIAP